MKPRESERQFLERRLRESQEAARRATEPELIKAYEGFARQYAEALDRLDAEAERSKAA